MAVVCCISLARSVPVVAFHALPPGLVSEVIAEEPGAVEKVGETG